MNFLAAQRLLLSLTALLLLTSACEEEKKSPWKQERWGQAQAEVSPQPASADATAAPAAAQKQSDVASTPETKSKAPEPPAEVALPRISEKLSLEEALRYPPKELPALQPPPPALESLEKELPHLAEDRRIAILKELAEDLLKKDPVLSLKLTVQLPPVEQRPLLVRILLELDSVSPPLAWKALHALELPALLWQELICELSAVLDSRSHARAVQYLETLSEGPARSRTVRCIALRTMEDPEAWLKRLGGEVRETRAQRLVDDYSRKVLSPDDALGRVQSLPKEHQTWARTALVRLMAARQPELAEKHLKDLPDRYVRQEIHAELARAWLRRKKPVEAFLYLGKLANTSLADRIMVEALPKLKQEDPDFARKVQLRIHDPALRRAMEEQEPPPPATVSARTWESDWALWTSASEAGPDEALAHCWSLKDRNLAEACWLLQMRRFLKTGRRARAAELFPLLRSPARRLDGALALLRAADSDEERALLLARLQAFFSSLRAEPLKDQLRSGLALFSPPETALKKLLEIKPAALRERQLAALARRWNMSAPEEALQVGLAMERLEDRVTWLLTLAEEALE